MNGDNQEFGPPRDRWAPQPPRRKSKAPLVIGLVALVVVALLCGVGVVVSLAGGSLVSVEPRAGGDPGVTHYRSSTPAGISIVLSVEGTGKADISFNVNGTGGSRVDESLPWSETLGPMDDFVLVSMVVQDKTGSKTQKLTGRITIGAKAFVCDATGAYAVATCSGSAAT